MAPVGEWVVEVAIDPRSAHASGPLSYSHPEPLAVGAAVIVPFLKGEVLGFVVSSNQGAASGDFRLKAVKEVVDNLSLPPQLVALAASISEQTACSVSAALGAAVPQGARDRLQYAWSLIGEEAPSPAGGKKKKRPELVLRPDDERLTTLQREALDVIRDLGGSWVETPDRPISPSLVRALTGLRELGLVKKELRFQPVSERRKGDELYRLREDKAAIERFLEMESRKRPAQALVLSMLLESESVAALTAAEIKSLAGVTDTTVKGLASQGLLQIVAEDAPLLLAAPEPNRGQKLAIDALTEAVRKSESQNFLLFGVTGSGKTEVYLRAAAEALRMGRQALYLTPEIALAAQSFTRLRERFGRSVALLHSELTPRERMLTFQRISEGEAPIVLGARSALFAPLGNLGLIIVDEEHETSYKQDQTPRYHAKRVAQELGRLHGCPVVLGSATPSVESFFEAEQGQLTLLSLPIRAANATLPEVEIEDLSEAYRAGQPAVIGPKLRTRIDHELAAGNQAILFLNRRAYAPFLLCRDCGQRFECPRCAVSLSFHRSEALLRCHHCGFSRRPPDVCPQCEGTRLSPVGIGAEKVVESFQDEFPGQSVARLDRDVAQKKGAVESELALFRSGETKALVGTQMVAKGLDFPHVTVVGIIAADVSMNLPDFRAGEKTFQLLAQVAGRAGRASKPGYVVIQTFNPDHPAVVAAKTHDYVAFYEALREERREANYPPFRRLANIVASGGSRPAVVMAVEQIADRLGADGEAEVLGPVDCVLERIRDRWRRHVLVKFAPDRSPSFITEALEGIRFPGVQIVVDVDPYSLM